MTQNSRRRVLKGLAISLPATWSAPLVKSVLLPAHAQTSGCYAPEGCYQFLNQNESFHWPGGTGYRLLTLFADADCFVGSAVAPLRVALAASNAEAKALLGIPDPELEETVPQPEGGCSFYIEH
jgi:hypothetical protein